MILFDIDGTLLLTGGAGKTALNRTFEKLFQIPNAYGDLIPDGKTDPLIIEEIAVKLLERTPTLAETKKIADLYIEYFKDEILSSQRFRLMPGIDRLIPSLGQNKNFCLGVATGNFKITALMKLNRGGLDPYFSFGGYGDDSTRRLELTRKAIERGKNRHPYEFRSEEIFLIGDTVHDMDVGKTLGLVTVAVATGSTPKEVLSQRRPDFIFDELTHHQELFEIFDRS